MKSAIGIARLAALLAITLAAGAASGGDASHADRDGQEPPVVEPVVACHDAAARDQDDLAIWVHPKDPAQSTIIASDKAAGRLFVYDLAGRTVQVVETPMPGNIDVRYGFPLGGRKVDIVAFNQRRNGFRIVVYAVDPATRKLERVDNGGIETGPNYGGTLYHSAKTGRFYFITTSMPGECEQYELADDGSGKVAGRKVRTWKAGFAEAAVADDERGKLYIGEESAGVWELGAEPDDPAPGRRVIRTGENGLTADVEGLAIHPDVGGRRCLVVSNQSRNHFKVYRLDDYALVGTFAVRGARD
ncbi:MAG: phytase, partial [Planctomycetes bacterium]|nr:phytase [Planctomycetota bacterium]